jgi:hypothetical protein
MNVHAHPQTDGFTYATDEHGDLLWFVSPSSYHCYPNREMDTSVSQGEEKDEPGEQRE